MEITGFKRQGRQCFKNLGKRATYLRKSEYAANQRNF